MVDFDQINNKIQKFIKDKDLFTYSYQDKDYKLPLSDAIFCAEDTPRNRKFFYGLQQAINDLGKDNITVVDAGSGTGILGIFALELGAKKVIMIEDNPISLELSQEIVKHFGYKDRVSYINEDANNVDLNENFDILVSETIKTNFLNEDFPFIIDNLRKYGNKGMKIIPEGFTLNIYDEYDNFLFYVYEDSYKLEYPVEIELGEWNKIYVDGISHMYDDIKLYSGECMSYFNKLPLYKGDDSSIFYVF